MSKNKNLAVLRILRVLLMLALLALPVQAQTWVQYGASFAPDGKPVRLYFSPESVRVVDQSVFVWTSESSEPFLLLVEMNSGWIRVVKITDKKGSVLEEDPDAEWWPLEGNRNDLELYAACIKVVMKAQQ